MRTSNDLNRNEKSYIETWNNRNIVLSEIGMTYEQYLKSDHWFELKKKASRRKRYSRCEICQSKSMLQLHHRHYRFLMHVNELHSIICLCDSCHGNIHKMAKSKNISVRVATNAILSKNKAVSVNC